MRTALSGLISVSEALQIVTASEIIAGMRDGRLHPMRPRVNGRRAAGLWFRRSIIDGLSQIVVPFSPEHRGLAWAMRRRGDTFRSIGEYFGIGYSKARACVQEEDSRRYRRGESSLYHIPACDDKV